jgi:hypothetical protein
MEEIAQWVVCGNSGFGIRVGQRGRDMHWKANNLGKALRRRESGIFEKGLPGAGNAAEGFVKDRMRQRPSGLGRAAAGRGFEGQPEQPNEFDSGGDSPFSAMQETDAVQSANDQCQ